jgi:hypothetical protein
MVVMPAASTTIRLTAWTKLTESHNRVEDVSTETGRKILEVLEIILANTPQTKVGNVGSRP